MSIHNDLQNPPHQSFQAWVRSLQHLARVAFHRRMLVLSGSSTWCGDAALEAVDTLSHTHVFWVGRSARGDLPRLSNQQVAGLLGRETDLLVYDAHSGFDADAFGVLTGTLKGGGILILLTPPLPEWSAFADPEHERIAVAGVPCEAVTGRFLGRLARLIRIDPGICLLEQHGSLPALPAVETEPIHRQVPDGTCRTSDQLAAVNAIMHVVSGHRRRPLVLVSDRGRGKSSALGIAAARLLQQGNRQILVTAPAQQASTALFEQAARLLPEAKIGRGSLHLDQSSLSYAAPDLLLQQPRHSDLLLVDEAAAIPTPLLTELLQQYPRIVFATTVHGYEGTGRGFALRFHETLDRQTPQWRQLHLETPIRWAPNDPLEQWLFRALELDARPVPDRLIGETQVGKCSFERLDRDRLAMQEQDLRDLFGLLVLAHYRTTPFDLRHLLDGPNLSLYVLRSRNRILATTLLAQEGGFEPATAQQIWSGYRRPRGHLLAQSLAAHLGLQDGACLRGGRIIRIAVHPALQRRGLGGRLVEELLSECRSQGLDYLGTSFGATPELLRFWYRHDLLPVRIGLRRGASSGARSVLLLHPLSESGKGVFQQARARFQRQLPSLLQDPLQDLEPDLAALLLSHVLAAPALPFEESDWYELTGFAFALRPYESCLPLLQALSLKALSEGLPDPAQARLLLLRVVQQRPWSECAQRLELPGRHGVERALRRVIADLVLRYADADTRSLAFKIQATRPE